MDMLRIPRKYFNYVKQCQLYNQTTSYSASTATNQILPKNLDALKTKVYDIMKWYEQLTGIDEIRSAQNKVIEAQDRFAASQEKRREVTLELNELSNKIKDIQEELSGTSRGEEKYITLITKEHKLLKEEIRLTDKLNLYEREERELFTTLTSSVKDSHEKERIQANKTKYLSIIGSVVGALIGITGSTLNNRAKLSEMKKLVVQSIEENKKELLTALQLESPRNDSSPSISPDEISKVLLNVSETLQRIEPELSKTQAVQASLTRIEKNMNSLLENTKVSSVIEKEDPEDDSILSNFTNVKEDVTYALMSCVSIYVLYRIFFS